MYECIYARRCRAPWSQEDLCDTHSTGHTHTHTTAEQTTHTNTGRATAQRRFIVEVVVADTQQGGSAQFNE